VAVPIVPEAAKKVMRLPDPGPRLKIRNSVYRVQYSEALKASVTRWLATEYCARETAAKTR
jgi:hypothetical protein